MQISQIKNTAETVNQIEETLNVHLRTNLGIEFVTYDDAGVMFRASGTSKDVVRAIQFFENNEDEFLVKYISIPQFKNDNASVTFYSHCNRKNHLYN